MGVEQIDLFGALQSAADSLKQVLVTPAPVKTHEPAAGSVTIHYAPRLRKGWRARFHKMTEHTDLTLPAYMEKPEFHVVRALVMDWAHYARRRKTQQNCDRLRDLEKKIWSATEQILADLGLKGVGTQRIPPIRPQGRVHHLDQVLEAVNQTYFKGELKCRITWSGRKGGLSFHTTRTDALKGETVHVISISRGYDNVNCPEFAVAGVVYHECLHIVIPPVLKNGRREVHGKAFRQRERLYLFYEDWLKWHRNILPRNVRML